jgi:hypothetical protein
MAAKTNWGWCPAPVCRRERRLVQADEELVMAPHNRWDSTQWLMVPCSGSRRPPGLAPAESAEEMTAA